MELEPETRETVPRVYGLNKSKIRQRIHAYCNAQENPKLYFVTVSFPPCVGDSLGYECLNNWLTRCRKDFGLRNYLWVAERQQIGTIHYHLLIPQYLNISRVNRAMCSVLVNKIQKKKLDWNVYAAKRYNGVDIAKDRNSKKVVNFNSRNGRKALSRYITKYVTKNNNKFEHFAWHCSRDFSAVFTKISLTTEESRFMNVRYHLDGRKKREKDFFVFVPWNGDPPWFFYELLNIWNFELVNKKPYPFERIPRGLYPFIGIELCKN